MTSKRISDQINTIRVATDKANVSPETALTFLRNAGIIPLQEQVISSGNKKGTTAKSQVPVYQNSYPGAATPKTKVIPTKTSVVKSDNKTAKSATSQAAYYAAVKKVN